MLEQLRRQVRPHRNAKRERIIAPRPSDQGIETLVREPGADIFRRTQYDLLVTALDKNVGQVRWQRFAARDGEKVLLVFCTRALDQRSDIEPFGLREYRRGDIDGIVTGEKPQYFWRGDRYWSQAERKQRARGLLDGRDQSDENVVDQIYFFFGVLIGTDQVQVGEVPQHDRAPLVRAVRDRAIELLDEFEWSAHRPWETVLVGHGPAVRNWLTSVGSVCEVGLAIRKDRWRLRGRKIAASATGGGYCFCRPQYFWTPLSQQPVLIHIDWRAPQFVTHIERNERSGFFLQFAMQVFCSLLHRIGTANAV